MKQLSLAESEFVKKPKATRRQVFLAEMDCVVPWARLRALIEPHYPKVGAKGGRPPKPLETMLRIHFMQQWFALSDPAMEEALHDMPVMRAFAGLDAGVDAIPDETTILNFRHLLEGNGLAAAIFAEVNGLLAERGLLLRQGTLVDATLIAAPSSTKNQEGKRDPEMSQTKKGNQWYFGMKAHIGVDADSGLVHTVVGTTAKVSDMAMFDACLHGTEERVAADRGYDYPKLRDFLAERCVADYIGIKTKPGRPLGLGAAPESSDRQYSRQMRASLPRGQAPIRLRQSALSRLGQEHRAVDDAVCAVEPVDGTANIVGHGRGAPMKGQTKINGGRRSQKQHRTSRQIASYSSFVASTPVSSLRTLYSAGLFR